MATRDSRRSRTLAFAFLLTPLLPPLHARAADAADTSAANSDDYTLTLIPYAWTPALTGTIGAKGFSTDVNESFIDIWDQTDTHLGFFGRIEGRAKRLGFYADGGYIKLGVDNVATQRGFGNADITTELGVIDFGLFFRLLDLPSSPRQPGDSHFSLDLTAGGQYWTLGLDFNPQNLPSLTGGKAWIDPMVGLRAILDVGRHLQFTLGGEAGGFDTASQFTWTAVASAGYVFDIGSVRSSVFVGYKAIADDYTTGSDRHKFIWDTTLYGPVLGMSFTF